MTNFLFLNLQMKSELHLIILSFWIQTLQTLISLRMFSASWGNQQYFNPILMNTFLLIFKIKVKLSFHDSTLYASHPKLPFPFSVFPNIPTYHPTPEHIPIDNILSHYILWKVNRLLIIWILPTFWSSEILSSIFLFFFMLFL
jgi:hypothetical protein